MGKGPVDYLSGAEITFWKDLIDKYLHPLDADKAQQVRRLLCYYETKHMGRQKDADSAILQSTHKKRMRMQLYPVLDKTYLHAYHHFSVKTRFEILVKSSIIKVHHARYGLGPS